MKFLRSAVLPKDYPDTKVPEIAIAGRSNAGKSSFINGMANSKIAKVSQEPGKTRLLNFFDVKGKYRIVDMPGYGFAARSVDEIKTWQQMIEDYLVSRPNLVGLVLVMDIRRDWTEDEELLKRFVADRDLPFAAVLSKMDKCNQKEKAERLRVIRKQAQMEALFPISSTQKLGIKEAEEYLYRNWVLEYSPKLDSKDE